MKIQQSIFLLVSFFISTIQANEYIIKQGDMEVTLNDLDGFAYKIPDEHRKGYFDSIQRLEKTLYSILNMKHIVQYGRDNNLVEEDAIDVIVNERVMGYFPSSEMSFNLENEKEILIVRDFLKNEEAYKQTQRKLKQQIKDDELIDLAEEKYIVNKTKYKVAEERTLDFISFVYDENNQQSQKERAEQILNELKGNSVNFKDLKSEYANKEVGIEIEEGRKFKYDRVNRDFSDKIFSNDDVGIINELIDINNRFVITNVTHIDPARVLKFSEVKEEILQDLRQKSAERKFNNVLISLTSDEIEVNENILTQLKSRYEK